MNVYENVGCIRAIMTVYESIWSYMNVNGSKWMYMRCMKLCDGIRMHMMVYGCLFAHMDVYESICWNMKVNGSKWEYMKV